MSKIISILMGVFGILLFIIAIATVLSFKEEDMPLLVFSSVLTVVFAGLTYYFGKKSSENSKEKQERDILQLVQDLGGRITPAELAAKSKLDLKESTRALEAMSSQGIAGVQVTDSGATVYVFEGLLSASEKSTSKNATEV